MYVYIYLFIYILWYKDRNHSISSCFRHPPGGSCRGCDPCFGCRGGRKVTRLNRWALQTKCRLGSIAGTGEVGQHLGVHMGLSLNALVSHHYSCVNSYLRVMIFYDGVCLIFRDGHILNHENLRVCVGLHVRGKPWWWAPQVVEF